MYNNPENIGPNEILSKMGNLGYGMNRNKRFWILSKYSVEIITEEQWLEKFILKN